jgi:DHA2 family methylenomycin A resistance protein-like MFS transporter
VLVNAFGWRSIFLINLPIGILGFLFLFLREKTTSHPMLPLTLFEERTFSAANVVAFCQTFTFLGFLFVMSLFLQQEKHYSPSLTGLALLPAFASACLSTSLTGRLMASLGTKNVILIGLLLSASGCFGIVLVDTQTSYVFLACLLFVLGGGLALFLPAMTEAAIAHAPKAQSGIASGMLNVSRQVGGVIGVAILGTLVGNLQTFLWGMHTAFVVCGGVLILGLVSAWVFMPEHARRHPKIDSVEKPRRTTRPAETALGRREKPE